MRTRDERVESAKILYRKGEHGGTVSGPGSTKAGAREACRAVAKAGAELRPETIVDVPCGDVAWIFDGLPSGVPFTYYGFDILELAVVRAHARFGELQG